VDCQTIPPTYSSDSSVTKTFSTSQPYCLGWRNYTQILRQICWGPEVGQIPDARVLSSFVDSFRRRAAIRPRKLWIADNFQCPPEHSQGWTILRQKIVDGEDPGPNLGRGHSSLDMLDGLLNEWGVHHLHLGTSPPAGGSSYVTRTGPVLFARITDHDFHAINVYPHGSWESSSILETLHRNWPNSIEHYRLNGLDGEPLTEKHRQNLRRVNAQVATTAADGTVYIAIGGGVASSGASIEAVMRSDMLRSDVEQLEVAVQEQLEKFLPQVPKGGYAGQQEIKAILIGITPEAFQVSFPDYGVLSNVTLEGGWFHGRRRLDGTR
jgi:hypothetical protein